MSKSVAEIVKRYIQSPERYIDLHDLAIDEAKKVALKVADEAYTANHKLDEKTVYSKLKSYESALETLLTIVTAGSYWSTPKTDYIWGNVLSIIGQSVDRSSGNEVWKDFDFIPPLLVFYGSGIAAIANSNYRTLKVLFAAETAVSEYEPKEAILGLHDGLFEMHTTKWLKIFDTHQSPTPLSSYLYTVLQPFLINVLPLEWEYSDYFDEFEYLRAISTIHRRIELAKTYHRPWAPIGEFGFRYATSPDEPRRIEWRIDQQITEQGKSWHVLQSGLFNGSLGEFSEARKELNELLSKFRRDIPRPWVERTQ